MPRPTADSISSKPPASDARSRIAASPRLAPASARRRAGYLLKNSERGELELALRATSRGELWLSPAISGALIRGLIKRSVVPSTVRSLERLTSRQREVLQLIAEGNATKTIAQRLHISVKTAESHRASLMERLDIHDVAGLVRYAIRSGITKLKS